MEAVINGSEDELVPGLRFRVPSGACVHRWIASVRALLAPGRHLPSRPLGSGATTCCGSRSVTRDGLRRPVSTLRLAGTLSETGGAAPLRFPQQSIMSLAGV
jgi:hypothetical protein